jgi:hypothetical protein
MKKIISVFMLMVLASNSFAAADPKAGKVNDEHCKVSVDAGREPDSKAQKATEKKKPEINEKQE